jgi:chromosomal replication initiator protein
MKLKDLPKELLPAADKIISDAERLLSDLIGTPVKLVVNLNPTEINETMFQTLICDHFNVSWAKVKSTSRKDEYVQARFVYCYLCKVHLGLSNKAIGEHINRDHSSVSNAMKKVNTWIKSKNPEL